jgi:hypothetical protein
MLRHEDDSPKDLPFAGSWLAPAGSRARTDGRDRDGGRDRRRSWRPSFREAAGHIRRRPSALPGRQLRDARGYASCKVGTRLRADTCLQVEHQLADDIKARLRFSAACRYGDRRNGDSFYLAADLNFAGPRMFRWEGARDWKLAGTFELPRAATRSSRAGGRHPACGQIRAQVRGQPLAAAGSSSRLAYFIVVPAAYPDEHSSGVSASFCSCSDGAFPAASSTGACRQQHRRLLRAASGAAGLAAGAFAVIAAGAGAIAVACVLLLMMVGLLIYARHWVRLAGRSRVGARSEDEVRRALAALRA